MTTNPKDPRRRQRRRAVLTALGLFGFVLLVYLTFVGRGILGYFS